MAHSQPPRTVTSLTPSHRACSSQCRDAYGNPAPRGRDRVAMVLTARGEPSIVARCDASAEGACLLSKPNPDPDPSPSPKTDPHPSPNPKPNP
jgi:hypothetical protein